MIVCPNCKHTNMAGALFCSECGAQLIGADMLTTQNMTTGQMQEALKQKHDFPASKPVPRCHAEHMDHASSDGYGPDAPVE